MNMKSPFNINFDYLAESGVRQYNAMFTNYKLDMNEVVSAVLDSTNKELQDCPALALAVQKLLNDPGLNTNTQEHILYKTTNGTNIMVDAVRRNDYASDAILIQWDADNANYHFYLSCNRTKNERFMAFMKRASGKELDVTEYKLEYNPDSEQEFVVTYRKHSGEKEFKSELPLKDGNNAFDMFRNTIGLEFFDSFINSLTDQVNQIEEPIA